MPKTLLIIIGVYLAACYLYGMYWVARLIWMKRQHYRSIEPKHHDQLQMDQPSAADEPRRMAA